MSPSTKSLKRYIVGVTGASGAIYACRLVEAMIAHREIEVHLIVTPPALRVVYDELGEPPDENIDNEIAKASTESRPLLAHMNLEKGELQRIKTYTHKDIGAGPASGTFRTEGMIICPCSVNSLGAIANGISNNLLTRAAAVTLKEGRSLILVPRETPLTLIDLRNMTRVAEAGGVILPANPGFYHRPESCDDLIDYVVQKIMDRLGLAIPGENAIRWGEGKTD